MDTEEAKMATQRKLQEWWPSIYRIINGFISYILVQGKKVFFDVLSELTGK